MSLSKIRASTSNVPETFQLESEHESRTDDDSVMLTKWQRIRQCLGPKLLTTAVVIFAIFITILCLALVTKYEIENVVPKSVNVWKQDLPKEQQIWYDKGFHELKTAIDVRLSIRRAKNVVLFVGDGMGPNTVTASRLLKYKEDGLLSWEKFPHMGMLKTYCADKQVPDSFSTATALFGGVKANYETGGLDSSVPLANCSASLDGFHHVNSILQLAQEDGMYTGFVTTTRVTHATPAALYSHIPDRRWECESKMPPEATSLGCKDIARSLIEDEVGKNINVIMGGGRQCLVSNVTGSDADPIDTWACYSNDGRDLISSWMKQKASEDVTYAVLSNNSDLNSFNTENTEFVLGIFANGHLKYDYQRDHSPSGMPSLTEMTVKALDVLRRKDKGFLLVVEGGNIDQAHHRGAAKKALTETLALDEAVKATVDLLKNSEKLDETLIIVTADHSHTLTINGYPDKGGSILGLASKSRADSIPYTTLTYGTSNGGYQVEIDEDSNTARRKDPSLEDTQSYDYVQQAAIYTDENTHGGSDVTIHAMGPMAHLFHTIHEQTYVAHVITYALRIGRFSDNQILESLVDFLGL